MTWKLNTKAIALTAVFSAVTVALNPVFSGIAVPAPYFPLISYQIWEIPIVAAFLLISPESGIAISLIHAAVRLSFSPSYLIVSGTVASLSMLLGIYLAHKLIICRVKQEKTLSERKLVLSYTGLGIVFRTLVIAVFNYAFLRFPVIGMNVPEPAIIATTPLIALFNITEPLYVIPLGYLISRIISKNLKVSI
jgi:riboflavin transporter FmnP